MDAMWWNDRFLLCDAYAIRTLNVETSAELLVLNLEINTLIAGLYTDKCGCKTNPRGTVGQLFIFIYIYIYILFLTVTYL